MPDFLAEQQRFVLPALALLLVPFVHRAFFWTLEVYFSRQSYWPKGFKPGPTFRVPSMLLLCVIALKLTLPGEWTAPYSHLFSFSLILAATWNLARLIKVVERVLLGRFDISAEDNLRARQVATQLGFVSRTIGVLLWFIGFSLALMSFEEVQKIGTSLLASAGLASVIIGFAAQKSIGNLIAGFQIAFTQPIRIDDIVIVEGEWGRIEEITLSYVVMKIWDERRLVIPISWFLEHPFQNWTRTSSQLLGTVLIHMDYDVPIEEIRAEYKKILEGSNLWDGRVQSVQVVNANDKTLEVRALLSTKNSGDLWTLRCEVREKLVKYLQSKYPKSLPKVRWETAGPATA